MFPLDPRTRAINALTEYLAQVIVGERIEDMMHALGDADLQPTTTAAHLAATAAVAVLVAHDLGQEAGAPEIGALPTHGEIIKSSDESDTYGTFVKRSNGAKPKKGWRATKVAAKRSGGGGR